jgi:hypothetical protein
VSAFVVQKEHVDLMTSVAVHLKLRWMSDSGIELVSATHAGEDEVGTMLLRENVRSVLYRYSDCTLDDLPGWIPPHNGEPGSRDHTLVVYKHADHGFAHTLSVGEIAKLIACYEYQSCEHPEWRRSEASRFCESLLRAAAHKEYAGPWDWGADDVARVQRERGMAVSLTRMMMKKG